MKKALLTLIIGSAVTAGLGTIFLVEGSFAAVKIIRPSASASTVRKFISAADFKNYLVKASQKNSNLYGGGVMMRNLALPTMALEKSSDSASANIGPTAQTGSSVGSETATDRYSSTNVQVFGIDEPDIVKTDGTNIFLSTQNWYPIYYAKPMMFRAETGGAYRYPNYQSSVNVIKANPVTDFKLLRKISTAGNLLLDGKVLMVFNGNSVKGYDVNASGTDKELWKIEYGQNDTLVGARLYNGKLFLATKQNINYGRPCPYQPFTAGTSKIMIPCGVIYHPISPVPTDILYTVSSFNTKTGTVINNTSFTGSNDYSILYMSPNAMYLTYFSPGDMVRFTYNFFAANKDLVPAETLSRLGKLISYDISDGSKQNEMSYIINQWQQNIDQDERMKLQNELQNRISKYYPLHLRELEKTSIVKTSLTDFKVLGVGTVPGRILNQFSMDEYNYNLRVAVTVGQSWFSAGGINASVKSVSDVYVLSENMATLGSVKDLGEGEQIYSARFIGERGYVVTFKQTDPFYVLDLSKPNSPKLAGELKVPGYSGYLEPISNNIILGVGKEDNKVKLALYDVSNANNPTEVSKYILDEYWSDALNDHHAFLKDEKHNLFFIPGSQGGYVMSYSGNGLSMLKAVSEPGIQRALYINDLMYIISPNRISAWDENSWNKVNELNLTEAIPETIINPPVITPMMNVSPGVIR
ncbi:MAG: beta-propeller domain-containing protein [Patescibacteria group bacterium]